MLHCTTDGSGRDEALQRDSSTSLPVTRLIHDGIAILYPFFCKHYCCC